MRRDRPRKHSNGDLRAASAAPLVAIIVPSTEQISSECQSLAATVEAGATAGETLVVSPVSSGPLARTYVVRSGDTLASIAASQSLPLGALESANPQLGPFVGRNWNRIYPGDRVTIPGRETTALRSSLMVTRAPRGPAPPALVSIPRRPANATSFQDAQYRHQLASARSINRARIATWEAAVARQLHPWQVQLAVRLRAIAGSPEVASLAENEGSPDLSASIQAAANTLDGLPGRRVLLLLGAVESGPPPKAMPKGSLAGVHVVVANLADPTTAAPWTGWAKANGASATVLDPALTQLQLTSVVNS